MVAPAKLGVVATALWVNDDGARPMAMQMFKKRGNASPAASSFPSRLDGWLTMLDRVQMDECRDVDLLKRALRYGLELSPIPKETWHLARAMSALTDDPWAKSVFARLSDVRCRQRQTSNEEFLPKLAQARATQPPPHRGAR